VGKMKVRNTARERLENGEMALGVGIRTARTVDIAKRRRRRCSIPIAVARCLSRLRTPSPLVKLCDPKVPLPRLNRWLSRVASGDWVIRRRAIWLSCCF